MIFWFIHALSPLGLNSFHGKLFSSTYNKIGPVGILTKLRSGHLNNWGSIASRPKDFSLLLSIQTGSGACMASYATDTGSFSWGSKVTTHIHPVCAMVQNAWATCCHIPEYSALTLRLFGCKYWAFDRLDFGEMGYTRSTLKFIRDVQPSSDPFQTDDNPKFHHIIHKESYCTLFHLTLTDAETEASESHTVHTYIQVSGWQVSKIKLNVLICDMTWFILSSLAFYIKIKRFVALY